MPSKAELVRRVEEIAPFIAERARSAELQRKIDDDVLKKLIEAEVFKTLVPKRFGGFELNVDTMVEIVRVVARSCPSTAWITGFYIGHNMVFAGFSEQAQEEAFAPRSFTLMAGSVGPHMKGEIVDGGYLLNGWGAWGSGVMDGDWLMASPLVQNGDQIVPMRCLLPMEEAEIDDVWHMAGMAATASNNYRLENVFVPEHRAIEAAMFSEGTTLPGAQVHDNPMYRMPGLNGPYTETLGLFVGALEAVNSGYQRIVEQHVSNLTAEKISGKTSAHIHLGEAYARTEAAGILLEDFVKGIITKQASGYTLTDRINNKAKAAYLVRYCVNAINEIVSHCGASSFSLDDPIQRVFRDLNFIGQHGFFEYDSSREQWGRNFLGLEPNSPLI